MKQRMPTKAEYEAQPVPCRFCGGKTHLEPSPPTTNSDGKVVCGKCGFVGWLSKNGGAKLKRESFSPERTAEVWSWNGDRCACCNLTAVELAFLGIGRTVQHTPDAATIAKNPSLRRHEQHIPLCDWCQALSAMQMGRMRRLMEHIAKRVDSGERVKRPVRDAELDAIFPEDAA